VTIKGIETPAELEMATSVGGDEVQGYFVGGPTPAEGVPRVLAEQSIDPAGAGRA
jgi:EAL domain-containing protein (putative c-di-GMP-specific phosphodiesterase class I)